MNKALQPIALTLLALIATALFPLGHVYGETFAPANLSKTECAIENTEADISPGLSLQRQKEYVEQGLISSARHQFDCAIAYFTAAIKLNPNFDQAYTSRANAFANEGEFNQAIQDLDTAIKINPGNALDLNVRGALHGLAKHYDLAIADFTKAIELDPSLATSYGNRGYAYHLNDNNSQALADLNRAIEISPKYATAYNNRGIVYKSEGDYAKAIIDYSKAIEIDPEYWAAYKNRANIYCLIHSINRTSRIQIIKDYGLVIQHNPQVADNYHNRGIFYERIGNYDLAIADFKKALELDHNNRDGWFLLGITYYWKGDEGKAVKAFTKAATVEKDPNIKFYPAVWAYNIKTKHGRGGSKAFARATSAASPDVWPAPLIALYQGKLTPGQLIRKAHEPDVNEQTRQLCEAYFYLGQWYLRKGDKDNAIKAFHSALATRQTDFFAYRTAQYELHQLGEKLD